MVRETRHLWVGNLPENIREDRIREHFKRYGRVQSVKLLPRVKDDEGSGVCATVSFIDIKSASKAHNIEQKLEDRPLSTEYHEPAAIPGGSVAPLYSSPRFAHGPPEEISGFERSSHFYERRSEGDSYLRRSSSTYHVSSAEPLRGRTRDRLYRNGPYPPIIESVVSSRNQPSHHRSSGWSYESASRYPPPASTPEVSYQDDRREPTPVVVLHKKHSKSRLQCRSYCRSGSNGSESGSNSGSSGSRSRSSSSSSQSGSSSCSSASSSPASDKSCSTHSHHGSLRSGVTLQSAVSTPHTNTSSPAVHSEDRRPLAICVRNLPARSSDTSLKDGLFHEYKKHGKVTWVKVVGQGADRYALVCFKKPEDVEKALQVSHDKLFFGCKIEVAPYQGYDVDDNEFRPYEAEQDEFHPKATRTLFIGNLEKDITAPELRKHFDQFGEIIEIDIKKQGTSSSYAFCQYCDIGSVVRAMRTLDGEHLGNNRIKLGFGKSLHTNCVWVDGVAESVSEKYLILQFSQFGPVSQVAIDRVRGHALVFYEQVAFAQAAVKEMRGVTLRGRKLQVDFASRECQEAFFDHLEKQTNSFDNSSVQVSPQGLVGGSVRGFETPSSSSSSSGGGRYVPSNIRYTSQQSCSRSASIYPRTGSNSGTSPGASTPSPSTPVRTTPRHQISSRFDFTSDYSSERRPYRSYEELGSEEGSGLGTVVVGPPDIRHLQKERVALLEQLEDCLSSGEEGGPRRRCKHRRSHSGDGGSSRPGTPLCDERPENLPPVEPRRTPRERPPDPLSLPLPRFASQVLSPKPAPPSPPASPPRPRSSSSDDSEPSPPSPEWEERLRSLDEKYEKWSGSRTTLAKVDASSLRIRHKLLDLDFHELQPSDIVKSVLAKRSVFDEDTKRLENFGEKYEPREFVPSRPGFGSLRSRLDLSSPIHSPVPKSPALSSSPAGAKGLQYPFPSHPPVQPTTSVATTTAAITLASCSGVVSTTSSAVSLADPSKAPVTFPTSCITTVTSSRQFPHVSTVNYPLPKISPTSPTDKKLENSENSSCTVVSTSVSSIEKVKSVQKLCTKIDKCDTLLKKDNFPVSCKSISKSNPCSRRESGEEKEGEGRRKSRDESFEVKPCVDSVERKDILGEGDKTKDTEMCDRRKRRSSVDLKECGKKDISESFCDKSKENNHRKEDKERRRDSVDNLRKDDCVDSLKLRLSEIKKEDCNSDNSETTSSNFESSRLFSDYDNVVKKHDSVERRKDSEENVRHPLIEPLDKKKDIFGVCSEKDRRRIRDNIENSIDSVRLKKVPDNLEKRIKKEEESDLRHRDCVERRDKDDEGKHTSCDHVIDRRKETVHSEPPVRDEISDRSKERDTFESYHQENIRHRDKKEHVSEKERRKDKEIFDNSDNLKHKFRRSPELHESSKHKEVDRRRLSESSDISRSKDCNRNDAEFVDDSTVKYSDLKREDSHSNIRHRESDKRKDALDFLEISKNHQKKESDVIENRHHKEYRSKEIENVCHVTPSKDSEKRKEYDIQDNSKHKESERKRDVNIENVRHRLSENKKDENFETKSKDYEKRRDSDSQDISRHKEHDKKRECEPSERTRDTERRKDCEQNDFSKHRETDELKDSDIENTKRKDSSDSSRHRDSERRKEPDAFDLIKNKDHDRKKEIDFVDYLRLKHTDFKKDSEVDNFKHKDCDKKKDQDLDNFKNRDSEHKKDHDQFDNLRHSIKSDHRRMDLFENLKHRDSDRKLSESIENSKRKDDRRKDPSETENSKYKDYSERKKENDSIDGYKHRDSERRREEKRKEKEVTDSSAESVKIKDCSNDDRRKDGEREKSDKSKRSKENEHQDRPKDLGFDLLEKRKDNDMKENKQNETQDKRKSPVIEEPEKKSESIKKEKRKDRVSSSSWPAAIGCKRRLSSQDSLDSSVEEVKRSKPERRDSKDSGRSSSSSSKKSSGEKHNKSYTKLLEEKIKEDKEKETHRKKKDEESAEEKLQKQGNKKDKRNSGEKKKDERKNKYRRDTGSESDIGSCDEEIKSAKKHSIFDIVDDEPAYISMYDKVKARSTKNMQKLEEEKRQERLKEKFNQLKQCRAKREEKKRSTSYDEDSDSERGGRRSNKLLITSSEEDGGSEGDIRMKSRKIMSDTSEDDGIKHNSHRLNKPIRVRSEEFETKSRKIMSDTSEDDTLRLSILRVKSSRIHSFENDVVKGRKITSDTSEDDSLRHNSGKSKITRIHSDESETDVGFGENNKTDDEQVSKRLVDGSDLFSNISEDHDQDHFGENEIETDTRPPSSDSFRRNSVDSNPSINEIPRKKSHKKKQKRQKNCDYNDDGIIINKRHSSKKDRRKSAHSRDGEDEIKMQNKIRKKKSDRDNNIKREDKMEDIFGPLSDDSDKVLGKWQVSQVYGSDSESEREVQRKREKKRRERKARELDEAGRVLEAKLMDDTDNYMVSEEPTKTKKKKRKKSREEKVKHHHRSEEEPPSLPRMSDKDNKLGTETELEPETKVVTENEIDLDPEEEEELPHRMEISNKPVVLPPSLPCLLDSPPHLSSLMKRPDIPGFGSQVDENIHETAVKSISESSTKPIEEPSKPEEPPPPPTTEDKPTPVISQEETEDAVAALLLEDAFGGGFESYPAEETPKPDTPVSEPDLQIDTDTEDTFDPVDFTKPPRTPDLPASYLSQDTREGLEERILAMACPDNVSQESKSVDHPVVSDIEKKIRERKEELSKIEISEPKTAPKVQSPDVEHTKATIPPTLNHELPKSPISDTVKRHELPAIVKQVDMIHSVKFAVHSNQQVKSLPNLSRPLNMSENTMKSAFSNMPPKPITAHLPPTLQQVVIKPMKEELLPEKRHIVCPPTVHSQKTYLPNQHFQQSSNQVPKLQQLSNKPSIPLSHVNCSPSPEKITPHQYQQPSSQQPAKFQLQQQQPQKQLQSSPSSVSEPPANAVVPSQSDKTLPTTIGSLTSRIIAHQVTSQPSVVVSQIVPPLVITPTVLKQHKQSQEEVSLTVKQSKELQHAEKQSKELQHEQNQNVDKDKPKQLSFPVPEDGKNQNKLDRQAKEQVIQPKDLAEKQVINELPQPSQELTKQPIGLKIHSENLNRLPAVNDMQHHPQIVNDKQHHPQIPNENPELLPQRLQLPNPYHLQKQPATHQPQIKQVQELQQDQKKIQEQLQQHVYMRQEKQDRPVQQDHSQYKQHRITQPTIPTMPTPVSNALPSLQVVNSNSTVPFNSSQPVIHKPVNAITKDAHVLNLVSSHNANPKYNEIDQNKQDPFDKLKELSVTKPDVFHNHGKPVIIPPVIQSVNVSSHNEQLANSLPSLIKDDVESSDMKSNCLENHIDSQKSHFQEHKSKETFTTEAKPLNAVIQDLTYKAAKANKHSLSSIDVKVEPKPIEQVVQEIHQRIKEASIVPELQDIKSQQPLEVKAVEVKAVEVKAVEVKAVEVKAVEVKVVEVKAVEVKEEIKTEPDESLSIDNDDGEVLKCEKEEKSFSRKEASTDQAIEIKEPKIENQENESQNSFDSSLDNKVIVDIEIEKKELESEKIKDEGKGKVTIEEQMIDKIRIKNEDLADGPMSPPDPVVAPLTPKMEEKGSAVFVNPGESSNEPCDLETAQTAKQDILSDEARDETKGVKEEPLITTLTSSGRGGRGGRRRKAGGRGGGVVTRRSRLNNRSVAHTPSADVYEFRDDSEEETGRPRLILTIKSPPEPPPISSTRKSRRLLERDGSRNTVDDTIEDVIRGTRSSTRRGGRGGAAISLPAPPPAPETRKSPRRKQAVPASTQLIKEEAPRPASPETCQTALPSTTPPSLQGSTLSASHLPSPCPASPLPPPAPEKSSSPPSMEPMTLIDPVTGLLIPMRESEEGQYIPVNNDNVRIQMDISEDETGEPCEKRLRTMSLPSEPTVPVSTSPVVSPSPPPPRPVTVPPPVRPGVATTVVKTLNPIVKPSSCPSLPIVSKPNNVVTGSLDLVRTSVPVPALTKTLPSGVTKPIVVSTGLSRPILPAPSLSKPVLSPNACIPKPPPPTVMMSPKTTPIPSTPSAVNLNRVVVAPSVSPATPSKTGVSTPLQAANLGVGIATTPINHKAHLLQAVNRGKGPVAKVPTPMTPKAHLLQAIGNPANCGAREGVVGPGTPPPPHHGSLLTGSVASPPLRAHSQQPVVTGASSSRAVCKNVMEPISTGGCIVVPSPSPQGQPHNRGQVMQAGLPVPAYEASMHGVVAELLPNPQWPRQSPPPAHQHPPAQAQGDVVQHVNYIQPAHYQLMYQQYLREAALGAAYQFTPGVKTETDEAARSAGGSPPAPLELRRGSPHDRTTDSPQVATLYVHGPRHMYYEGPHHPPPAHRPSQPRLQVATPPHASQVPPQADSLLMLLQRYPVMWQGLLALKNDQAAVQMHFVFGNPHVARDSLPCNSDGSTPPLRIAQRMRLEQTQVEGVARKMQMDNEHCMLLALPCGRDHMDVLQQSNNLQSGFITYLQQKQAAGIVNIAAPGSQQAAYVVHIFPACDFANESLARIAPDLLHRVADIAHLLIVIATV